MTKFVYWKNCTQFDVRSEEFGEFIKMMEESKPSSYAAFRRHCKDLREFEKAMGYAASKSEGLTLSQDWHVEYFRSTYAGHRAYYLVHSAIEHIWLPESVVQNEKGAECGDREDEVQGLSDLMLLR